MKAVRCVSILRAYFKVPFVYLARSVVERLEKLTHHCYRTLVVVVVVLYCYLCQNCTRKHGGW